MAQSDEALLADLKGDARKRGMKVLAITGAVLLAPGAGLLALGVTFEPPKEQLATRPVPQGTAIALIVAGVLVMIGGLAIVICGQSAAGKAAHLTVASWTRSVGLATMGE